MDAVMTKPMDEAIAILKEEVSLLQRVLFLEERKYQALKEVNLEDLMNINDQEELLLQEIHTKEEKRQQVFHKINPKKEYTPPFPIRTATFQLMRLF